MKFLTGLIGLVLLALALCFALSNRQNAAISLWPLGLEVAAPLYLLTLGTLFAGFLLGLAAGWLGNLSHRFEARRLRKEISGLNDKIMDLQQTVLAPLRKENALPPPKSKWRFWEKET